METKDFVEYEDQQGRLHFATLVHWIQAIDPPNTLTNGPAHCLMQAVFLPRSQLIIFLAELKTCHRWRGIYHDTDGVANAAWGVLDERFEGLSHFDVEWILRCGQFSSYDLGLARTSRYFIKLDSEHRWRFKKYECEGLNAQERAQLRALTGVPEVDDDLEKLPKMPPPYLQQRKG